MKKIICTNCGVPNNANADNCTNCGTNLSGLTGKINKLGTKIQEEFQQAQTNQANNAAHPFIHNLVEKANEAQSTLTNSESEKAKKTVIRALIGGVVGFILMGAVVGYFLIKPSVSYIDEYSSNTVSLEAIGNNVEKELRNSFISLNKTFPLIIDNGVRLDSLIILPENVVEYDFTLVEINESVMNTDDFKQDMQDAISVEIEKNLMLKNIQNGIIEVYKNNNFSPLKTKYLYRDKNGNIAFAFTQVNVIN